MGGMTKMTKLTMVGEPDCKQPLNLEMWLVNFREVWLVRYLFLGLTDADLLAWIGKHNMQVRTWIVNSAVMSCSSVERQRGELHSVLSVAIYRLFTHSTS